ncbi:hypothetical protein FH972_020878 [Carpinus fangiana]|uniref:Uncharacterized protein n=1 Tax=Carpinus fangiana TaxID=176857 RepID=A0A5N6RZ15_9ROSI|nr:hypothetical protein FH972_020878 [Carpinus fangiana]
MSLLGEWMTKCQTHIYYIALDGRGDQEVSPHNGSSSEIVHESTPQQLNGGETMAPINGFATQEPLIGGGWPIFRVPGLPAHVREVDKGAYTPKIVSIGPFHRNYQPSSLKAFEIQKKRFLSRLQKRITSSEVHLENAMKEMEEKTRECYSEDFGGIKSEDFVQMMLLDGCFIVELLRLYTTMTTAYKGNVDAEPILETRWMLPNIGRDLLMLENQLPMFVLQKIYEITTTFDNEATDPLNKLALRFFEPLRPGKDKLKEHVLNTREKQKHPHLLALFHSTFISTTQKPSSLSEKDEQSKWETIHGKVWALNAKKLTYAGVRFQNKSGDFLDIEYNSPHLKIPTLFIDDGTSTLLRNLIAYEQSNRGAESYFSCLAVFMDSIVDTVDDIKILHRAGIIKQLRGSDQEVVDLFNSLTKGVEIDMDNCYIKEQIIHINSRCRAHDTMVRFRHFLSSTINLTHIISTYQSAILTFISIWLFIKHILADQD